jgi:hypothetical protein
MLYNYSKPIEPNPTAKIRYEKKPLTAKAIRSRRSQSQNLTNIITSKITNRSSGVKLIYQAHGILRLIQLSTTKCYRDANKTT